MQFAELGANSQSTKGVKHLAVLNKKTRMITFRLTAAEYAEAVERCKQHGHRSVSAMARAGTLGINPEAIRTSDELLDMQVQISELRREFDRAVASFGLKLIFQRYPGADMAGGLEN